MKWGPSIVLTSFLGDGPIKLAHCPKKKEKKVGLVRPQEPFEKESRMQRRCSAVQRNLQNLLGATPPWILLHLRHLLLLRKWSEATNSLLIKDIRSSVQARKLQRFEMNFVAKFLHFVIFSLSKWSEFCNNKNIPILEMNFVAKFLHFVHNIIFWVIRILQQEEEGKKKTHTRTL